MFRQLITKNFILLRLATAAIIIVLALSLPLWANPGITFRASLVLIYILFAASFNQLFNYTGLISFGQAAYFATGAYVAALYVKSGASLSGGIILAVIAGGLVAAFLGYISLRASGIYFAILTLALGQIVYQVIFKWPATGGENGLADIPRGTINLGLAQISLASPVSYYYLILICVSLGLFILWAVTHSNFGRILMSIKQNHVRASFLGINVRLYQLISFAIAGSIAGLAGAVYGPLTGVLMPEMATWIYSTTPILLTLMGGANFFWGPATGAVIFGIFEYLTRAMTGMSSLIMGLLLLTVVLAFPGGILGLVTSWLIGKPSIKKSSRNEGSAAASKLMPGGDVINE